MGRILRDALRLGALFGAFAPLVGIVELLLHEQWNSLTGQFGDDFLGSLFLFIGFAGITVFAFLVLFTLGFSVSMVRGMSGERRTDRPLG